KLKALADKKRLKIVELLLKKDYCVKALAKEVEMSESAVSQHLKRLREVGLIVGEKRGYWVHYVVQVDEVVGLGQELIELTEQEQVEEESNCCHK
ncbi:MAG: metalloregulator ArsR/SmtB family transcription factor, partial [Halanaerobacter sp.]